MSAQEGLEEEVRAQRDTTMVVFSTVEKQERQQRQGLQGIRAPLFSLAMKELNCQWESTSRVQGKDVDQQS